MHKLGCIIGERFKTIEEYLDVENNILEENKKLIMNFDPFEVWTKLSMEHQVDVDSYEGQTRRIFFLHFDVVESYKLLMVCWKL